MRFVYSVVRFVPDPARGEFVNVAAIVGSEESSEWAVRQVENPVRARAIDQLRTLDAVWTFLDAVGRDIDRYSEDHASLFEPEQELSENWLLALHAEHQNIVQLSPPTPMLADSADDALDVVFEQMVLDPAYRRHDFQKKHVALAAVRNSYRQHMIRKGEHLRERVRLETQHHHERFDFAVLNGRVLQLANTWSFQIPDQDTLAEEVRAWGWTMRELKDTGARVVLHGDREVNVRHDVDISVVYVPPRSGQSTTAMDEAMNVFERLGVSHCAVADADRVGRRARDLLVAAGTGHLDLS